VAAKAVAVKEKSTGQLGRLSHLFTQARWRRHTLVGLGLAVAGQIGLWSVGFYTPELIDSAIPTIEENTRPKVQAILNAASAQSHAAALSALDDKERRKYFELVSRVTPRAARSAPAPAPASALTSGQKERLRALLQKAISEGEKTSLKSRGGFLQQIGAFFGISCFTLLAARFGRRASFFIALLLAWGSLLLAFATFHEPKQIWYLWPILGFGTLAPFGGYAIYFPELFPTRLRTTGTSFCYNVGRYITAFGPLTLGPLARGLDGVGGLPGFRLAAMVMTCSYVIGIIALIWAPETVNQTLPEDEPHRAS